MSERPLQSGRRQREPAPDIFEERARPHSVAPRLEYSGHRAVALRPGGRSPQKSGRRPCSAPGRSSEPSLERFFPGRRLTCEIGVVESLKKRCSRSLTPSSPRRRRDRQAISSPPKTCPPRACRGAGNDIVFHPAEMQEVAELHAGPLEDSEGVKAVPARFCRGQLPVDTEEVKAVPVQFHRGPLPADTEEVKAVPAQFYRGPLPADAEKVKAPPSCKAKPATGLLPEAKAKKAICEQMSPSRRKQAKRTFK